MRTLWPTMTRWKGIAAGAAACLVTLSATDPGRQVMAAGLRDPLSLLAQRSPGGRAPAQSRLRGPPRIRLGQSDARDDGRRTHDDAGRVRHRRGDSTTIMGLDRATPDAPET